MATGNLLNTRTATFLELVGNGRTHRVPPYQRDYSWSEEQWDDLWSDLVELRAEPEGRHYMGALVVQGHSDRDFLVIDGQQRLATLTILALAVIGKLQRLASAGVSSDQNRERAAALRGRFIGEKDPASLLEVSKLFLNETNNGFFQDYLVQLRTPVNASRLPRSNRLLWECLQYFSRKLEEDQTYAADGEAVTRLVTETVGRQLLFIHISVDDELSAYTVFETLNARGLELSTTDLLKNYLFSRFKVASDLEALQRRWRSLLNTVREEHFPDFLRYHLLCELPRVRSEQLFKVVRDRVRTPGEVFALLDALERRSELFAALEDTTHPTWREVPEARRYVYELRLFRSRQMIPLLFAAWDRFSREDFGRTLKLVSVVSFRYSVVSGLNPSAMEPAYHAAARDVLSRAATSPRDVAQRLGSVLVDDRKFEEDFAQFAFESGGQRRKLAKYILARLEEDASQRSCDPETDPASIEHILPENPSSEWDEEFPPETAAANVYRLGNLTLLEKGLNREVANGSYARKLDVYQRSGYELTRGVVALAPSEWTCALLEERQRRLAQRAVHVWRTDFVS